MKGRFGDRDPHPPAPTMFSNLHPQPPRPPPRFAVTHHQFHLTNTSEEADNKKQFTNTNTNTNTTNDGASIEVVRRPRGRPPGSKNKPKPPVVITREPDPCMSPYVLELAGGSDIVDAVTRVCNHRDTGLCVLSGSGTVSNVSLRQPSSTITFHGCFELLSISATVLPSSSLSSAVLTPVANNGFTISLAGPQGQMVGGAVAGPLIAAGTVYIIAASFNNPLYHRLPMEEDENVKSSGGGSATVARDQSPGSGGGDSGRHHAAPSTAVDSLSMYSCHQPSDVIWAPTPRQAPPRPPLY